MNIETHPNKQIFVHFPIIAILLSIVTCAFYFGCSQNPSRENAPHSPMKTSQNHNDRRDRLEHNHSDPEKQKRMGIFHYNKGNKFLRKKEPHKAIKNYKMALQHTPVFFEASNNLATAFLQGKMFDKAHQTLMTLQEKNKKNPLLFYNLACYYALTAQTNFGLEALQKAVALGYKDFKGIKSDPDLKNLRKDPKFTAWIKNF